MLGPRAPGSLALSPTQRAGVGVVLLALALFPVSRSASLPPRDESHDPRPPGSALLYEDHLDLNAAAEEDLETLPMIGSARALAIVEKRDEAGGFCALEEVRKAARMGKRDFGRVLPWVTLTPPPRCRASSPG